MDWTAGKVKVVRVLNCSGLGFPWGGRGVKGRVPVKPDKNRKSPILLLLAGAARRVTKSPLGGASAPAEGGVWSPPMAAQLPFQDSQSIRRNGKI